VLINTGEDGAAVSGIPGEFNQTGPVMEIYLLGIAIHFTGAGKHMGREDVSHHTLPIRIQTDSQHLIAITRIPQEVTTQKVNLVIAGFGGSMPHMFTVLGKDH
jgi:hypothetical protein